MNITRWLGSLFCLLFLAPAATAWQAEAVLKDSDLRKLSKPMSDWVRAVEANDTEKALDARQTLEKAAQGVQKKLKGKEILSLVKDWEKVLEAGRDYKTSGEVRKDKAVQWDAGDGSKFTVRAPRSYNPKKGATPMILVVGGRGKSPADLLGGLPEEVQDACILVAPDMRDMAEDQIFKQAGRIRILRPLGVSFSKLRVDRNRVYLLGQGANAGVAARYAAMLPHFFAAVALVGSKPDAGLGGPNLGLFPVQDFEEPAQAASWLLEQPPRNAYPLDFGYVLTEPWAGRAFWVQAMRFDPATDETATDTASSFKVTVDRAANTITVDANGVYQLDFFLNDQIVDLSKPVVFIRNGVKYEYQASRSIGILLENFKTNQDARAVFPARVRRVDVPQE